MLGIEQPIVQAPMAAVPGLAAAVSNAGALGMVTLTWSPDAGAVGSQRRTSSPSSPPACNPVRDRLSGRRGPHELV
jgi:nitronate monooxygenase